MKFTQEVSASIEKILYPDGYILKENLQEKLPDYVYEKLKNENNLGIIEDKITFRPRNLNRPYDSFRFSKFLTPDLVIAEKIERLFQVLHGHISVFIDFDFLIDATKDAEEMYKFEFASKFTAMNNVMKITSDIDVEKLCNEFRGKDFSDILNTTFINHVNLNDYSSSGFRPQSLLAMKIYLQIV